MVFGFAVFLLSVPDAYSQLITSSQTPTNLVQNVLLGGGVQVSNINYVGSSGAIGFFNGANTNIGLESGIIMTTGAISGQNGPQGPNNRPDAYVDLGLPGPPPPISTWLIAELGATSFQDAAVLSFDFIPKGSQISFRYVFGSEEYNEYVNTQFNDAFAFFVQGPGIPGGVRNIAKIPSTNLPVAVNNVNNGYSSGCSNGSNATNPAYYVDNCNGSTIQYDGFTKVLTAQTAVIPCSTYRFYMVISDAGINVSGADGLYDSGVFVEAKSFSTEGNSNNVTAEIVSTIPGGTDLFEGCGSIKYTFFRYGNTTTTQVLNYTVTGTATNGTDYNTFGTSVTFAPGVSEVTVMITPVSDGIVEPDETITVTLIDENPCPDPNPPTVTVTIKDYLPPTLQAPADVFNKCNKEPTVLEAIVTGGAYNIIQWDNGGGTGNPVTVSPNTTTTYTVTLTDQCSGNTLTDQVTVHVPPFDPLTLVASNDTAICGGEAVVLFANSSGGIGDRVLQWSTGDTSSTITVAPQTTTSYTVSVSDSCGNFVEKTIKIMVRNPTAAFTYRYVENDKIQLWDGSTSDVVSWLWIFGDGDSSTVQNPEHKFRDTGLYTVTLIVRNYFGCYDTVSMIIRSYPPFKFYIPNAFTPTHDFINDFFDGKGEGFVEYEMMIFNRWGEQIFNSNVYGRGWPGIYKGKEVQLGVYLYKFKLKTPVGEIHRYQGHVTLLR